MTWILWLTLGLIVVGVKYYTGVGARRLERRLNKVKADLGKAKKLLRERKESYAEDKEKEELGELRVRNMRELIEDMKNRIDGSTDQRIAVADEREVPMAATQVFPIAFALDVYGPFE